MKKKTTLLVFSMLFSLLLSACGGSETTTNLSSEYEGTAQAYDTSEMTAYTDNTVSEATAGNENVTETAQATNRKLIKNVGLSVETTEYDTLVSNLEAEIKNLGGYVESMEAYNGNRYEYSQARNASICARIPAAKLDGFVSSVGEKANIVNRTENVEDVTLTYVDMDSHKKMLQEEQGRLLELLDNASGIDDIITIESRLSEVRYQIESMESQLRTFDNQVDYSTVNIDIEEVVELTPVVEESAGSRIKNGLSKNFKDVIHGIREFFIEVIIAIPYLLIWAIVIVIIVFIVRAGLKISDKRNKERREKKSLTTGNVSTQSFVQRPQQAEKKETKN